MIHAKWITDDETERTEAVRILKECLPLDLSAQMEQAGEGARFVLVCDDGALAAAGVLDITAADNSCLRLGPVAALEAHRRKGLGGLVMRMLIRRAFEMGFAKQSVSATAQIAPFFAVFGFRETHSGNGIIRMEREGDISGRC